MIKNNIKWILSELPYLKEINILDLESHEKIKTYYEEKMKEDFAESNNKVLNIVSIIGGILIGLGIILLFAYNWKLFGREIKAAIGIVPLVVIQGIILFGKIKGFNSTAFKETTAAVLSLVLGSSMAIISQAYQIQGDIDSFLTVWMLLLIPMVYILRSNISGFIYFALTIIWASYSQINDGSAIWFWFYGLLIIPYYYLGVVKKDRYSSSTFFFTVTFIIWILSSVGVCLEKAVPGLWIIIYSLIIFIMYYTGIKYFAKTGAFSFFGKYGTIFMAYLFTFEYFWRDVGLNHIRDGYRFNNNGTIVDYIILGLLAVYFIYICIKDAAVIKNDIGAFIFLPVLSIAAFFTISISDDFVPLVTLGFNIAALLIGVFSIYIGVRGKNMAETNLGMFFVGLLICTRFFDFGLGFIERSVAFLILGVLFISTNIFIKKRIGAKDE